jgi:hypothetical protein
VQAQDRYADCTAITAEIEANNQKVKELASEQGLKVGQNVAAGVAGLVVWPLLFAMDFQDSAGKEVAALQSPSNTSRLWPSRDARSPRRPQRRRFASAEAGGCSRSGQTPSWNEKARAWEAAARGKLQ